MNLAFLTEALDRTFWIAIIVIPVLFLVEYFNHEYGEKLLAFFEKRKKLMPFWAALFSMLPGCNVAAAIAILFARGFVSMGSLAAAMIATSDEAVYVFIPERFNFLPLFGVKLILAILVGFLIDFTIKSARAYRGITEQKIGYCCSIHDHKSGLRGMFTHTLRHGLKIIFFIFTVLLAFNFFKDTYGFEAVAESIISTNDYQPLMAGFLGLIPGCGTSVVLATLYTQGILGFGGTLAGLSVASGDTLIVLLANKVSKKEIAKVIAIVLGSSIFAGYISQIIEVTR